MATQPHVITLQNIVQKVWSVDQDKLFRGSLGTGSLKETLGPRLEELRKRTELYLASTRLVSNSTIDAVVQHLSTLYQYLSSQASRDDVQYMAQRQQFIAQFDEQMEAINNYTAPFISSAIYERGLLQDEGIRKQHSAALAEMQDSAQKALETLQSEAKRILAEAEEKARQIESSARKTAQKISVKEAQEEFKTAQTDLDKQVKLWAILSVISALLFIGILLLMAFIPFNHNEWSAFYYGGLRLSILLVIGGSTVYFLHMLRAHVHMSHLNKHRQRVANSIQAFVESAGTPGQRDAILAYLVSAVASFGNSGLVPNAEESGTRLLIEQAGRVSPEG